MIRFLIKELKEIYVKENFQKLEAYLNDQGILKPGFKLFELTFSGNIANFKYKHGLGYVPTDLIQTSLRGQGSVVWNYSLFDRDTLDITVTGTSETDPLIVRALIGSYREN
jgi:hypothetical protein